MKESFPRFLKKRIDFEPGEKIFLIRRKHWYVFRNSFLFAVFVPFLFLFFSFLLSNSELNLHELLSKYLAAFFFPYLTAASFFFGVALFIWQFYLWRKTAYLVTNKRIIIVRQNNPVSSEVHQMTLNKMQDVISKVRGIQAALYGFGDVSIQASSSTAILVFKMVGNPHEVQRQVMTAAGRILKDQDSLEI